MDDKQVEEQYGKPESQVIELKPVACDHFFVRKTHNEFGCSRCSNGWFDNGRVVIENGKILKVI
jgi:hypothetical protein